MVPGIGLVKCQVKLITCSGAVTADGSVGEKRPTSPDERDFNLVAKGLIIKQSERPLASSQDSP